MSPTALTITDTNKPNENTDGNNACQEDAASRAITNNTGSSNAAATAKVDKTELTHLGQEVNARRYYELDKIRRHRMEATEDIERYKKEKLQRMQAQEEEKKRDLQMLTNYYPWGRSLGNFERTDYRKQKWNRPEIQTNYMTRTQELSTPSQIVPTQSLRWPLDPKNSYINEGAQEENLHLEKDKLELNGSNDRHDTEIQLASMKEQNPDQENTQNIQMQQEERILDSSGNGHKRKYVTSEPNSKNIEIVSPRMKRSPSPSEVMRARAARVYMEELKKGMEEQRKRKEEMEKEVREPIGELATVMGKGKVGRPRRDPLTGLLLDNHLRTSDVSKEKIGKMLHENLLEKAKYGHDLIYAAEERYRMKELEKLKAKQQEIQHQETYNDIWGRPGGGAPRDSKFGNRMAKLGNMLYKDSLASKINNSSENQEHRFSPIVRYSTHQNQYDYPNNMKTIKEYNFKTPWASYL